MPLTSLRPRLARMPGRTRRLTWPYRSVPIAWAPHEKWPAGSSLEPEPAQCYPASLNSTESVLSDLEMLPLLAATRADAGHPNLLPDGPAACRPVRCAG
jgi:hypothetical protein